LETADRTEIRENLGEDLMQILFVGRSELTSYPDPPEPTLEGQAIRRIEPWGTQGDISNEPERNDGECNYT
jgi:hypothetical protein